MMKTNKSNACGIVGLCTGWLIPIVGLILGIVALARKEPDSRILGTLSIIESVLFWIMWMWIYFNF